LIVLSLKEEWKNLTRKPSKIRKEKSIYDAILPLKGIG